MDNKLILIIAVVVLFLIYQRFQKEEKMSHINDEGTMSYFDETILRPILIYKYHRYKYK